MGSLCLVSIIYGQFTDLKEYGLNGKVKTIEKTFYQFFEEKNGELVPADSLKFFKKEKVYVNRSGNIDSLKRHANYANYKLANGKGETIHSTLTFKYDQKGNKISGIETVDGELKESGTIYSFSFKSFMYTEKYTTKSGSILGERVVYLNQQKRDSLLYERFFSFDKISMDLITRCYYTSENELYTYVEVDKLSGDTSVIRHAYVKKDEHKNPVLIYLYRNGSKQPLTIITYRYTYYKD